jgi:hypothetical protein
MLLYYETHASRVGYAATYVAFATALFFMLVVERVFSSTLVLLARMVWGVGSVPDGCLEEPMDTLAAQLLAKMGSNGLSQPCQTYLQSLSQSAEDSSADSVKGYASMQMVGAGVSFFSSVGGSVAGSVVDGFTALSGYLIWMAATTLVFALLFIVQVNPVPLQRSWCSHCSSSCRYTLSFSMTL